jgi:hypothetical protein
MYPLLDFAESFGWANVSADVDSPLAGDGLDKGWVVTLFAGFYAPGFRLMDAFNAASTTAAPVN